MADVIFPSQNDVGGGREVSEAAWQALFQRGLKSGVVSGLDVNSTAGLDVTISAGEAVIDGVRVVRDDPLVVAVANDETSYVYLRVVRDAGGRLDTLSLATNTTGTPPADSILLAIVVAASGSVTATTDARVLIGGDEILRRLALGGPSEVSEIVRTDGAVSSVSGTWPDGSPVAIAITRDANGLVEEVEYTHHTYGTLTLTLTRDAEGSVTETSVAIT